MYGSCVARDTIEFAAADAVDLRGYVARQSLISAGNDASTHIPADLDLPSKFQERMIRADFAGGLFGRLESLAGEIDVLLWDLADERHGIYRFADGTIVTRSIDTIRTPVVDELLSQAEHIEFGTSEHLQLWRKRVDAFDEFLRAHDLFERTVVLEVPWALRTTEGKTTPWSMGVRATDANKRYRPYYDYLRQRGHHVVELREADVLADPDHRWGLAPFHYTPDVYQEVLRQLRDEHGYQGFAPKPK